MKNEDASGTDAGQLQAWGFDKEATVMREALLDAQFELADRNNRAVLILLNGADGAGKGQVLNRLHEWLDPRTLATLAYDITDRRDQRRPPACVPPPDLETPVCVYAAKGSVSIWSRRNWAGER